MATGQLASFNIEQWKENKYYLKLVSIYSSLSINRASLNIIPISLCGKIGIG